MIIKCVSCEKDIDLKDDFNNCPFCGCKIMKRDKSKLIFKMQYFEQAASPYADVIESYNEPTTKTKTLSCYLVQEEEDSNYQNGNREYIETFYSDEDPKKYNYFYMNENFDIDFSLNLNSYGLNHIENMMYRNPQHVLTIDDMYSNLLEMNAMITEKESCKKYDTMFTFDLKVLKKLIPLLREHDKVLKFNLKQIYFLKEATNTFVNSIETEFPAEYLASLGE